MDTRGLHPHTQKKRKNEKKNVLIRSHSIIVVSKGDVQMSCDSIHIMCTCTYLIFVLQL